VEVGGNRTGVPTPEDALSLARVVDDLPGVELRGVFGFPTPPQSRPIFQERQTVKSLRERRRVARGTAPFITEAFFAQPPELFVPTHGASRSRRARDRQIHRILCGVLPTCMERDAAAT